MWTYNMSAERLFQIESSYAVIQSKICGANVLNRTKIQHNHFTCFIHGGYLYETGAY